MTPLGIYQAEFAGLLMGDNTSYDLVEITGLGFEVRGIDVPRLDVHGSFPTRKEVLDDRTVEVTISVFGDPSTGEFDQNLQAFGAAFQPRQELMPFRFNIPFGYGQGARRFYAYVRRVGKALTPLASAGQVEIPVQMKCIDPRIYSDELFEASLGRVNYMSETGTGLSFPISFPLHFGGQVTGGSSLVENIGNFPADPIITIRGPVRYPRIALDAREFEIDIELGDHEYLIIDFDQRSVLLNGTASRYTTVIPTTDWWNITPGVHTVRFYSRDAGQDARVIVNWRSAWL